MIYICNINQFRDWPFRKPVIMSHKAGFVSILGIPNVGKSTLMNLLVGERLAIVSHKIQTTRHRILGIITGEGFQVVFSDTPGILKPHYRLHEAMMAEVYSALGDADVILLVTETGEKPPDEVFLERLRRTRVPVIVVVNKIDLSTQPKVEDELSNWNRLLPGAVAIPVSALHGFNVARVFDQILDVLPESPAYFPPDQLTDRSQRFFVAEIIREKILLNYAKEVPYSVEVAVDAFKEEEEIIRIKAFLYVGRESQKAILLGHQGKAIRKLGTEARKDIEEFLDRHVYLELIVKVSKDWREDEKALRRFGYITEEEETNENPF